MKKIILCINFAVLLIATAGFSQPKHITVNSELQRLYDIAQLPKYVEESYEAQKSSYDTTGGNDDGFSGKYSFVRKNPDGTLVIFEAKGKGVINRIWTATPNDDILDFYFDGDSKPSYSISFRDLFTGKVFPFVEPLCGRQLGGNFCYLPIPFNNGCKIVSRGKMMQFYQIQYRHYSDDYDVKTFNPEFNAEEKASLQKIKRLWGSQDRSVKYFYQEKTTILNINAAIKPGQSTTLLDLHKGGTISGLEINTDDVSQLVIKANWNNEKTPAIYAPAADFFGYSFGTPSMQSLLLGSVNHKNYCYFPMPFDNAAKIVLFNQGNDSKTIRAKVFYIDKKRNPVTEGKFYAYWNTDPNVKKGKPHVFLQTTGKGHYVGSILQARGLNPGMTTFFEGDDSTATDGVMRIHGTGSEDYFNGGWYALMDRWDTRMSLPLHGALDYSLPLSRTGAYRLYLNDKLSFDKSIFQSIEHGPEGNDVPADYTSVALYYADAPPSALIKPTDALTRQFTPDTLVLYPQLMSFSFWGDMAIKSGFGGYIFTAADDARMRIALNEVPYGRYKLYADVQKDPQGADISVYQRQTSISDWISLKADKTVVDHQLFLCDITIGDFKNTLTFLFKAKGDNNKFVLSKLIFVKQK